MEIKRQYDEINISTLIKHWVDAYEFPEGMDLLDYDYFIDQHKGKCMIKLILQEDEG